MKLKTTLLLSAAVAALSLSACGDDAEPTPSTPTPEATPEATPEPTPEPTPEATPEAAAGPELSEPAQKFLASLSDADKAKTNPKSGDAAAIKKGAEEYASMCKHCHGPAGKGDGPVAQRFKPPASDLSSPARAAQFTPGVNFQVMLQGIPGTAMQAFGAATSEDTVWSILAFTETLVASAPDAPAGGE